MIYRIKNQVLTVLSQATSPYVYAGGNAFAAGWTGVKNVFSGDTATANYVNLHERSEQNEAIRPAVYLGGKRTDKLTDRIYRDIVMSDGQQFRQLNLPIVILCKGSGVTDSLRQAEQLAGNISAILQKERVRANAWHCLTVRGVGEFGSGTGGAADVSEARMVVNVEILYSWSPASNA